MLQAIGNHVLVNLLEVEKDLELGYKFSGEDKLYCGEVLSVGKDIEEDISVGNAILFLYYDERTLLTNDASKLCLVDFHSILAVKN